MALECRGGSGEECLGRGGGPGRGGGGARERGVARAGWGPGGRGARGRGFWSGCRTGLRGSGGWRSPC